MHTVGARVVVPQLRPQDQDMPLGPWVDPANFNPGYMARGIALMPRQGNRTPWQHSQDYWRERDELPMADLERRLAGVPIGAVQDLAVDLVSGRRGTVSVLSALKAISAATGACARARARPGEPA